MQNRAYNAYCNAFLNLLQYQDYNDFSVTDIVAKQDMEEVVSMVISIARIILGTTLLTERFLYTPTYFLKV